MLSKSRLQKSESEACKTRRLDCESVLAGPLIPTPLSLSRGMGARTQGGEALLRGCRVAGCTDVMSGVAGEEVGEYEVMRLMFKIASRKVSSMSVLLDKEKSEDMS